MGRYLVQRFLLSLFSIWILATLCFFLVRTLPGRPFSEDIALSPVVRQAWEKELHLQEPWFNQYFYFWRDLAQGHLGRSYQNMDVSVESRLAQAFPVTWALSVISLVTALIGAFVFSLSLQWSNGNWDRFLLRLGFNTPNLIFALLLSEIFAVALGWLPVAGLESPWAWVLPILSIALRPLFKLTQILTQEFDHFLQSDVARTFFSLGFTRSQVLQKWSLRLALLPFLSYAATLTGHLIGGTILVEILFAIPGSGALFAEALSARDYPLILGETLVIGSAIFLIQFFFDALLAWLDPRLSARMTLR